MKNLVERLAGGSHHLTFGRPDNADRRADLKAAIERKYVLLKFTETRGGTELGLPLDPATCDLSAADFDQGTGRLHLEGDLTLDYVSVRMIAELDVATLEGEGRLRILDVDGARERDVVAGAASS